MPTSFLADRYQSTITGDFLPQLVMNRDANLENGARNRASYENRDWRMKSTIMWDGETYVGIENGGMELRSQYPAYTWMYGTYNQGAGFINNDASGRTGYIYRKWIRQEAGWDRTDGPQDFYLMRLADVYLMYAEAVNETNGPTDECVALLNKIRSRGNLPALAADKYADKEEFFKTIEQERIVELATEGHRPFDIRRWRKAHDVFGPARAMVLPSMTPTAHVYATSSRMPPNSTSRSITSTKSPKASATAIRT
nr:RagB/SusD family nutrient uptake outer membrane protein [Bacteroides rodentium]